MLEEIFNITQTLTIIKILFLIVNGIYVAFLLVVYKQSKSMQAVVNDGSASSFVSSIAFINIVIGISLFVAALIIL